MHWVLISEWSPQVACINLRGFRRHSGLCHLSLGTVRSREPLADCSHMGGPPHEGQSVQGKGACSGSF